MTWSLPLGSISGIRLQVHFTFLALLGWMVVSGWQKGDLSGVVFFLGLFLCVLLHELGHALMARHYGIKTTDITLLPIGGVARLERMPEDPRQELWVALAGPAVNVVIAAILYVVVGGFSPQAESIGSGPILERLLLANITLVVFNLLPAFPMDGGRVLRALLATRMEYTKATQTAATVGQVMAVLFGFVGFFLNPFLILIAVFVWIGAGQEASMVQVKSALGGIPVRAAMLTDFQVIGVTAGLDRAVELILAGSQLDFPVMDGDAVVGMLTRDDLLQALARKEERGVRDVMRTDIQPAQAGEMLEGALQRLQQCACRTMPVMQGERLVGLLTTENVGEFLTIQAAVGKRAIRTLPMLLLVGLMACGGGKQAAAPEQASAYADARSCAPCHPQQAKPYALTGMGRSFKKASAADAPAGAFAHEASGRTYTFAQREGKLFLQRTGAGVETVEKEIHYVLGSGNSAKTYLHRTPQNRLLEMPVNWYSGGKGFLAMSPGYDRADHMDMRRTIGYQCMFCHNGYPEGIRDATLTADPVYPGAVPEGIDCQRCHGPGRAHIESVKAGKPANIYNPKHETPAKQMEVCMQCHLETTSFSLPNTVIRPERGVFSFNPREPLEQFIAHFDHAPGTGHEDKFEIVSSVYRLRQSQCFLGSAEKLTCTTCHNPHETQKNFDAQCSGCHSGIAKAANHPAKKECASCHMPKRRTEDVVHVAVTDHKIQRPGKGGNLLAARAERHEVIGQSSYKGEVVLYYPPKLSGPAEELLPAMAQLAHQSNVAGGVPRLQKALAAHTPQHPYYYLMLAQAQKGTEALAAYRQALAIDPNYLPALRNYGVAQGVAGVETLEKATKLHPGDSLTWLELARLYRQARRGSDADTAARRSAELEPELVEAHAFLGSLRLEAGDKSGAATAFRAALREQPDHAESLASLATVVAGAEAEGLYLRAIRQNPKLVAARFNFALFLANARRFPEAIPQAREAVQLDPANSGARDLLANLYMAVRDFGMAAATYRATLDREPQNGRALLGLGTALGAVSDFAGARRYFGQAAQSLDPAVRGEAMEMLGSLPR